MASLGSQPGQLLFTEDSDVQAASCRFGRIDIGDGFRYAVPAATPAPRTMVESQALLDVLFRGAEMPVLAIPATRRKLMMAALDGILSNHKQSTLFGVKLQQPLVVSDPESEALSFPCLARNSFLSEGQLPAGISELMSCTQLGDTKKNTKSTQHAWADFLREFQYSMLAKWAKTVQLESGSRVFLAPTPLVRALPQSFSDAWQIGWTLADQASGPFRAVGVHLLLQAEIFLDTQGGRDTRATILDTLRRMASGPNPRGRPIISFKIVDGSSYLAGHAHSSTARRNLGELVLQMAEHVRAADGLVIGHNLGTWGLSLLAAGCDITTFRCDGKRLYVEPAGWSKPTKTKGKRKTRRQAGTGFGAPHLDGGPVQPWDPDRLSFGRVDDFKAQWAKTRAYPTTHFADPDPWWDLPKNEQRRHVSRQIIGSMLELGQQLREAGHDKTWRLADHLRNRMKRMDETHCLLDLYPLL